MHEAHATHQDGHRRHHAPGGIHRDDQRLWNNLDKRLPTESGMIVVHAPEEPFRLSFFDVTCLIINRTIGTGIFTAPQVVMRAVQSPGIAIVMWLCGCLYGMAGSHVFLEYGLNVPRFIINGVEQSVPRSGGELHYLQYIFPWPRYSEGTVIFMGVLFGISFICVGNMASNCIDCALRILEAANPNKDPDTFSQGTIYGIAILVATVTCFIHAFSRRGGILLNNGLAIFKIGLLLLIIMSCWVVAGRRSGVFGLSQDDGEKGVQDHRSSDVNGYSEAFLAVIFAFFGFDQPSYVLGEVQHPRKNLPRSMWWGMGTVSVLYVAVNICFMIIVPADVQIEKDVPREFFDRVFNSNVQVNQAINSLLAISSFGNIVVWTYTAARMKQEIAKQCFIPFASFFGNNKDVSLGRLLQWLEGKIRIPFINPANHRENTPVGALVLHLATCIVLIAATFGMSSTNAYTLLSGLFSYILAAWFGAFLALGILILHFRGPPATQTVQIVQTQNQNVMSDQEPSPKSWKQMIRGSVNPKLGIFFACLYLIGNLYPVIMRWVPPKDAKSGSLDWYLVPAISWCILAFSGLWFLGFITVAGYWSRVGSKKFIYKCEPEFEWADRSHRERADGDGSFASDSERLMRRGGLILVHETITKSWEAKETSELLHRPISNQNNPLRSELDGSSHPQRASASNDFANTNFANTDFAELEMNNIGVNNSQKGLS